MAVELRWHTQGRVIEIIVVDGHCTAEDVRLLDVGIALYLNVAPHDRVHLIVDSQLMPHCALLQTLHDAKIGWVVERGAQRSPFGRTHRFYNAPNTQEALLMIANLESQAPTAFTL